MYNVRSHKNGYKYVHLHFYFKIFTYKPDNGATVLKHIACLWYTNIYTCVRWWFHWLFVDNLKCLHHSSIVILNQIKREWKSKSSVLLSHVNCLLGLLDPEDGGAMVLVNGDGYLPVNTA